ncbi:hypothetical protein Tco_1262320 [Tanacetum coccineum]
MATNEETNAAGTDTRPPMLVENDYESWKIRIHRYIRGKPNGKLIWKSIQNGPTPHPMITDPPPTGSTVVPAPRKKLDSEFNEEENKLEMADTQAEIILSQGRTLQQRKEDLFDEYKRFCAIGNESIHDYFVRFHKLVNDMKITQLNIPTHQMNTKFVNNLPAYWDKYVTNVKQKMDIMKVLNVRSTEGSCDQQALETDRIQLKDTITSLRIQLDGLKVENVSLQRRYDKLSKANTHSRTAYTEKLSALTAENTKLKALVHGKTSSGPSTSETPKVLAPGIYNLGSKYIPPPKRANWVKPTPLPKKKQVIFQEPPRTSNRPTQKPPVQQNKKPNVSVNLSTRTKPATESRKPMPKSHTRNHRILPSKSVNARRAADHNRKLNVVDHNQFVVRSLKSVNTKTPQAKHSVNHLEGLERKPGIIM